MLLLTACTSTGPSRPPLPAPLTTGAAVSPGHPNIVFILTDDLSWNLVKYMPHVVALQSAGTTFSNYIVTDSLCCPSRASIFTGNFPHDTQIYDNTAPEGGFDKFTTRREDDSTFATNLFTAGYRTALLGKYLNGYDPSQKFHDSDGAYVPPGWTTWSGINPGGYSGYGYVMAKGHSYQKYGHQPADFTNTVLQHQALDFLASAKRGPNPFFLELATFSPHAPFTPAPADVDTFSGLRAPRAPDYDQLPSPPPQWMVGRPPLTDQQKVRIDIDFRKRVESVQSVDRLVASVEDAVARAGQTDNTVFVFSSDNGYHLGEHRLPYGKQTAFDTDVRVPLVVAGPGIAADAVDTHLVQNIDLRPTFDDLAGTDTPQNVDGASLVPLLHGQPVAWRDLALIEHKRDGQKPGDPDAQTSSEGNPPTYNAIRSASWTYVRYADGDREYYDLVHDPNELHNLGPGLSTQRRAELDTALDQLIACHGTTSCWRAGEPRAT
jgi:N-acetylglucosamine-6-sulfatase